MVFPNAVLEDWEKVVIISNMVTIVTRTMFVKHFYTFGGRTFQQFDGGPIVLRGTCGVAGVVMQIFDSM